MEWNKLLNEVNAVHGLLTQASHIKSLLFYCHIWAYTFLCNTEQSKCVKNSTEQPLYFRCSYAANIVPALPVKEEPTSITRVHDAYLDQVSEAWLRWNQGICHGEELNPVLIKTTWVFSRLDDESPQAAPACFVPQSQQSFPLCHVEADV